MALQSGRLVYTPNLSVLCKSLGLVVCVAPRRHVLQHIKLVVLLDLDLDREFGKPVSGSAENVA